MWFNESMQHTVTRCRQAAQMCAGEAVLLIFVVFVGWLISHTSSVGLYGEVSGDISP